MEWINVEVDTPNVKIFHQKKILVLVNGEPFICSVIDNGCIYVTDNRFIFSEKYGWEGDPRFAKPTHWMPIPELSEE